MSAFPGRNAVSYPYLPPCYPPPSLPVYPVKAFYTPYPYASFPHTSYPSSAPYAAPAFAPQGKIIYPKASFSALNAAKETVKGVLQPIVTLFQHPFKSAFVLGATVALTALAPITVPLMVLGGLGFGAFQTAKGIQLAHREYTNGNYAASEKAFRHIGEGLFGLSAALLGVRSAGAITAEAKASRAALDIATSASEKLKLTENGLKVAHQIKYGPWLNAFKETCSVLTPEGLKTLGTQLNPVRVGSLLKGRADLIARAWQEKPVADLNAAVQKAQAYLGIKTADMPRTVPELKKTLPFGIKVDKSKQAHGFYDPKEHTIHIQPDRLKAMKDIKPALKKLKLPPAMERFLGNAYKQSLDISEIATHELTHARQWNAIRKLSAGQARQIIRDTFPSRKEASITKVMLGQKFENVKCTPAELAEARENLMHMAKFRFKVEDLEAAAPKKPGHLDKLRLERDKFREYVRYELEVEAREQAAEAMVAAAEEKLKHTGNVADTRRILNQARTQLVEARLNKMLREFTQLEQTGQAALAQAKHAEMMSWANMQRIPSPTHGYLRKEALMQKNLNALETLTNWGKPFSSPGKEPPKVSSYIKLAYQMAQRIAQGIGQFFTPSGLNRYSQGRKALRPTYYTLNNALIEPQTT